MLELNEKDADILRVIKKEQPISIEKIEAALPGVSAVEFRTKAMCSTGRYTVGRCRDDEHFYIRQDFEPIQDELGMRQMPIDAYSLTSLGEKTLQDYDCAQKRYKKEIWLKNAWIPILVSVATNLLVLGIKWLLPQISGWLSNIP